MSQQGVLDVTQESSVTVLTAGPRQCNIDDLMVQELHTPLVRACNEADPPRVVIDLGNAEFVGSSFIELLLPVWGRLEGKPGGRLAFCNLSELCQEVFDVTNLTRLWEFYNTRADAIAAMGNATP
jgi:anti-anti-sigma factor